MMRKYEKLQNSLRKKIDALEMQKTTLDLLLEVYIERDNISIELIRKLEDFFEFDDSE